MKSVEIMFYGDDEHFLRFESWLAEHGLGAELKVSNEARRHGVALITQFKKSKKDIVEHLDKIGLPKGDEKEYGWRHSKGSVLDPIEDNSVRVIIKGKRLKVWRDGHVPGRKWKHLEEYMEEKGATTDKNVLALMTDIAKANGLTMEKLVWTYCE